MCDAAWCYKAEDIFKFLRPSKGLGFPEPSCATVPIVLKCRTVFTTIHGRRFYTHRVYIIYIYILCTLYEGSSLIYYIQIHILYEHMIYEIYSIYHSFLFLFPVNEIVYKNKYKIWLRAFWKIFSYRDRYSLD